MNQKTSKVEKEFYLRCSYLTLSVLFDKEPYFYMTLITAVNTTDPIVKISIVQMTNFVTLAKVLVCFFSRIVFNLVIN